MLASLEQMAFEQDQRISEVVKREQSRLRNFIRGRVPDPRDAEDILQDVFYKLVEANGLLMPIEHVTGWLFRVARNRITDLFRKRRPGNFSDSSVALDDENGELLQLEDLLPPRDANLRALSRSMRALRASRINARFLRHSSELLGDVYEIVIKRNGSKCCPSRKRPAV